MNDAATKPSRSKGTSTPATGKKLKAGKKAKATRSPNPKKERPTKEAMVVFAFRLTPAQRDRIHQAAGPGKATRFVRTAALAAADGDRPTFDQLIKK